MTTRLDPKRIHFKSSVELCEYLAQATGDTVLLGFSNGKDSIAAWWQLKRYWKRVVPVYRYAIPGLRFVEESLAYYEQLFGERVVRLPDPNFYSMLLRGSLQTPRSKRIVLSAAMHWNWTTEAARDELRRQANAPDAFIAAGWRASDSLRRRLVIKKYGAANYKERRFYPIFDWNQAHLLDLFRREKILLPVDYRLFHRSWEGVHYRYLEPIRRHYPDDYQRILEWFPLAKADLVRRKFYEEELRERREAGGEDGLPQGGQLRQEVGGQAQAAASAQHGSGDVGGSGGPAP